MTNSATWAAWVQATASVLLPLALYFLGRFQGGADMKARRRVAARLIYPELERLHGMLSEKMGELRRRASGISYVDVRALDFAVMDITATVHVLSRDLEASLAEKVAEASAVVRWYNQLANKPPHVIAADGVQARLISIGSEAVNLLEETLSSIQRQHPSIAPNRKQKAGSGKL